MGNLIDSITARELRKLGWHRPEQLLINLRYIETDVLSAELDERVRRLRTNNLKEWREGRDAALFAYGLEKCVLNRDVAVAKAQSKDYDFVVAWQQAGAQYFYPVQLKELPPEDLNPDVQIEDLYDKLEKYSGLEDLSVAIRVNRSGTLTWGPWCRENRPKIREIWYFGCVSPDQSQWFICGDMLYFPHYSEFTYPAGVPNISNIKIDPRR